MPYTLFQGGRRRRRRRAPAVLAIVALLAAAAAAVLLVVERAATEAARRSAPRRRGRPTGALDLEPLAGGGTAPSPLAVRLDQGGDPVRARFKHMPRAGLLFDIDTGRVLWRHQPDARAADRLADEDDDRARGHRPREARARGCRSRARRCTTRAPASGCSRAGKRIRVGHDAHGLLLPSGNDAAIALAQRAAGTVPRFVDAMNARAPADGPALHALLVAARLRGPRQPLVRRRPRGDRPRRAARAAAGPDRAPPRGGAAVPDQGRQALPLQLQPAAAAGLPRHHGHQDRLHGRGRPLPRRDRAARGAQARRRAAALARPGRPGAAACSTAASRSSAASASPRAPARASDQAQLVDLRVLGREHAEAHAVDLDLLALVGQPPEVLEHDAADRGLVVVLELARPGAPRPAGPAPSPRSRCRRAPRASAPAPPGRTRPRSRPRSPRGCPRA